MIERNGRARYFGNEKRQKQYSNSHDIPLVQARVARFETGLKEICDPHFECRQYV
jgi:hypothetical protein